MHDPWVVLKTEGGDYVTVPRGRIVSLIGSESPVTDKTMPYITYQARAEKTEEVPVQIQVGIRNIIINCPYIYNRAPRN